ncbi:MAG: hypothetical protein KJN66_08285 [Bacteroidia bacterium]|nr:hypothetical protein [Bacteroidia bacterium]
MRINNARVKNTIITVYFLLLFAVLINMLVFGFFRNWINNTNLEWTLIIGFFVVVLAALHSIAKYFEYDSDGDILVILNRGLIVSEIINYRERLVEIPKRKLLYYKLKNYGIYKSLNLYIRSGKNRQKRIKFNVTLVPKRKLRYLKMSLNKIVKQNKENR